MSKLSSLKFWAEHRTTGQEARELALIIARKVNSLEKDCLAQDDLRKWFVPFVERIYRTTMLERSSSDRRELAQMLGLITSQSDAIPFINSLFIF